MMDKNEIIERLGEIAKHSVHTIGEEPFIMSLDDGTAVYEAIDIIQQSQPQSHWIPCSERLPEKSGKYYVSGEDRVWICEFLILPNFIGGWCNDVANPEVQAWMPCNIPKPYREGE